MSIDLIDLSPNNTRNNLWITDLFQCNSRTFNGILYKNTFPLFIVQGSRNLSIEERSLNYDIFKYLSNKSYYFGLIHIMDENYDHDLSVYELDKCLIIFREYYRPRGGFGRLFVDYVKSFFLPTYHFTNCTGFFRFAADVSARFRGEYSVLAFLRRQYLPSLPAAKEVKFFPLGCTDRVQGRIREMKNNDIHYSKIIDRKYRWSFCGQSLKKDRKTMLESLKICHPHFIYESDSTGNIEMLPGEDYYSVLLESIFVPCPLGNINIDTYRLFEALEAGAIPVITNRYAFQPYDYYKLLLGDHPIPSFTSWHKAALFLKNASDDSIDILSSNIRLWYDNYKLNLKNDIFNTLSKTIRGHILEVDLHFHI